METKDLRNTDTPLDRFATIKPLLRRCEIGLQSLFAHQRIAGSSSGPLLASLGLIVRAANRKEVYAITVYMLKCQVFWGGYVHSGRWDYQVVGHWVLSGRNETVPSSARLVPGQEALEATMQASMAS